LINLIHAEKLKTDLKEKFNAAYYVKEADVELKAPAMNLKAATIFID
jgi:hypothetical protein